MEHMHSSASSRRGGKVSRIALQWQVIVRWEGGDVAICGLDEAVYGPWDGCEWDALRFTSKERLKCITLA